MPRKKKQAGKEAKEPVVRFNVSVQAVIYKWAKQIMADRGYSNISAFIGDLIRRAQEREEERQAGKQASAEVSTRSNESPTVSTTYK
jgi:metal-responsive CopG/Arc/MetJ family transcriptional regulator